MNFLSLAGVALHEPRLLREDPLEMTGVAPCDIDLGDWTEIQMHAGGVRARFTRECRDLVIEEGAVVWVTQ